MEIKIELVKIKLGKKEIELSIDDAKKLQAMLNDTFSNYIFNLHTHWVYNSQPVTPIVPYWQTTCSAGGVYINCDSPEMK